MNDSPTNGAGTVQVSGNAILLTVAAYAGLFVIFGLAVDGLPAILKGLLRIITSRDTLITDYIGLGGMGAAFVNAGLLTLATCFIYYRSDAKINGTAVACLFLVLGFGLFGKSILNVWFIVIGVWLYSKYRNESFGTHINTAFFGCALAPIFSEVVFSTSIPLYIGLPLGIVTSLLIGFILVPVAARLFKAHEGYSLYNMGFAAGITGTLVVSLYRSYGFVPDPVFIWTTGNNLLLGTGLIASFVLLAALGIYLDRGALAKEWQIMAQSGQAPTDFIGTIGIGPTLVNMALTGTIGACYVLVVGGDLNGPTIGAILTIVGFSAAGKHPKNILPIMLGVFLGSLSKSWNADDPSMVLAALFGTTLAPIAGQFGWFWGIVAGFVHSSAARSVGDLHGGLVLYNNGFAAGLVASILTPVIAVLQRRADQDEKQ